ncbi:uncharacterized protein LOC125206833 [Salvia hispanica]|uniref:uncharacterized protein LOC125206833 n=1 Tax=Salvia hispanica TaxID=49212 RepID=UPI00200952A2|nr:uncharacterized protein LOC125206833 [Salvia hispanica]
MASGSGSGSGNGSGSGVGGSSAVDWRQIVRDELRAVTSREINRALQAAMQQQQQPSVPRPIRRRTTIPRDRIAAHHRLYADYFAPEPRFGDNLFRRRFRMSHPLFLRIVGALERRYEYFRMQEDAVGKPDHTPVQKCTAAIRQLAYGGAADMFDEYLHIGESIAHECLEFFCAGVREIFGDTYLWKPIPQDCQELMTMHGSRHGFPGMLGSIDCMHWKGRTAPPYGKGCRQLVSRASISRLSLRRVVGSNNDFNVLQSSPLFNDQELGVSPTVNFDANDNQHNMSYYLPDEIYPMWPVFVKTTRCAIEDRKKYFADRQEAARKDVERVFGVLQSRWAVVKGPSRLWHMEGIVDVMYACTIMHNMIVEYEGPTLTDWFSDDDDGAGPSHGVATPSGRMGVPHEGADRVRAYADMRQRPAHIRLQNDLIEELWLRRGRR